METNTYASVQIDDPKNIRVHAVLNNLLSTVFEGDSLELTVSQHMLYESTGACTVIEWTARIGHSISVDQMYTILRNITTGLQKNDIGLMVDVTGMADNSKYAMCMSTSTELLKKIMLYPTAPETRECLQLMAVFYDISLTAANWAYMLGITNDAFLLLFNKLKQDLTPTPYACNVTSKPYDKFKLTRRAMLHVIRTAIDIRNAETALDTVHASSATVVEHTSEAQLLERLDIELPLPSELSNTTEHIDVAAENSVNNDNEPEFLSKFSGRRLRLARVMYEHLGEAYTLEQWRQLDTTVRSNTFHGIHDRLCELNAGYTIWKSMKTKERMRYSMIRSDQSHNTRKHKFTCVSSNEMADVEVTTTQTQNQNGVERTKQPVKRNKRKAKYAQPVDVGDEIEQEVGGTGDESEYIPVGSKTRSRAAVRSTDQSAVTSNSPQNWSIEQTWTWISTMFPLMAERVPEIKQQRLRGQDLFGPLGRARENIEVLLFGFSELNDIEKHVYSTRVWQAIQEVRTGNT